MSKFMIETGYYSHLLCSSRPSRSIHQAFGSSFEAGVMVVVLRDATPFLSFVSKSVPLDIKCSKLCKPHQFLVLHNLYRI